MNDFKKLKLHLGCWTRYIPGWIHIDQIKMDHIDYVTKVHDLHMFEDGSCGEIYASHVLEYYDWQEAESWVLPEWRRVLCSGGVLRVAVPDFESMTKLYLSGHTLDRFIGPLYGRMLAGGEIIYHKCVYDEAKLSWLLSKCLFRNPRRYDWRQTEHANIDDHSQAYIPHMDKEKGTLISLNMEAVK